MEVRHSMLETSFVSLFVFFLSFFSQVAFTLGARALVPGQRQKLVLRSDIGTPSTQVPFSSRV